MTINEKRDYAEIFWEGIMLHLEGNTEAYECCWPKEKRDYLDNTVKSYISNYCEALAAEKMITFKIKVNSNKKSFNTLKFEINGFLKGYEVFKKKYLSHPVYTTNEQGKTIYHFYLVIRDDYDRKTYYTLSANSMLSTKIMVTRHHIN